MKPGSTLRMTRPPWKRASTLAQIETTVESQEASKSTGDWIRLLSTGQVVQTRPVKTLHVSSRKPQKFLRRRAFFCASSRIWKRLTNPSEGAAILADFSARLTSASARQEEHS